MEPTQNNYKIQTTVAGAISEHDAKEMIKAAAVARVKPATSDGKKDDVTNCVWFSLD